MSDEMKVLNEQEVENVTGGAAHANGQYWSDGGATYYRIAPNDYLGNIAQMFGTTPYAIQALNPYTAHHGAASQCCCHECPGGGARPCRTGRRPAPCFHSA